MKCNKVKNPCKICFQSVSKKNGLQCQGACQKWAHFKCLHYTPGKIQDIKSGAIKITCPCPDCNTEGPKEILTDPPFTCTNTECPANKLPVCSSVNCPSKEKPMSSYPASPYGNSPVPHPRNSPPISPCPPPRSPCPPPRSPCPPPRSPCPPPKSPCPPPKSPCPPSKSPCSPPKSPCPPPKSPPCVSPPKCSSPKPKLPPCQPSPPCNPTNTSSPCPPVCPPTCPSYQKVKNAKKSFSPKQSQSCSDVSKESSSSARQFDKMRTISSDSKLPASGVDPKILFSAIESLCNTVGQLSNQLRNLMCKMQSGYGL